MSEVDFSRFKPVGRAEAAAYRAAQAAPVPADAPVTEAEHAAWLAQRPPEAAPSAPSLDAPTPARKPRARRAKPAVAPAPEAPAVAPAAAVAVMVSAPAFVGGPARVRHVPLTFPVSYGGQVYAEVYVQRPTSAEVDAYLLGRQLPDDHPDKPQHVPVFFTGDGSPVPAAVLDALDDDDDEDVLDAARRVLPRRLLRVLGLD